MSPSKESTVTSRSGSGVGSSVVYSSTVMSSLAVRSSRSDRIGLRTAIVPSPGPLPGRLPAGSRLSDSPGTSAGTTTAAARASAPTLRPVADSEARSSTSPEPELPTTRPHRETRSWASEATSTR